MNRSQSVSAFDQRDLRDAFGRFATGVTVATTVGPDGTPRGFTANSFTSVSLDPPLLLVCIGKVAASLPVFCEADRFAISILAEHQRDLAHLFASKRADKFSVAEWQPGRFGMPLLAGVPASFECRRDSVVDAGDHVILIGRVEHYDHEHMSPLGYVNGSFFTLEMEQTLVKAASRHSDTILGAVLVQDNGVLLHTSEPDGPVFVPNTRLYGVPPSPAALVDALGEPGFDPALDFLLSVYEDRNSGCYSIYYRGRATGRAPNGMRFFEFAEIPFDRVEDGAMRFMLRRHVEELRHGRFTIYHGDERSGEIRPVGSDPEKCDL